MTHHRKNTKTNSPSIFKRKNKGYKKLTHSQSHKKIITTVQYRVFCSSVLCSILECRDVLHPNL